MSRRSSLFDILPHTFGPPIALGLVTLVLLTVFFLRPPQRADEVQRPEVASVPSESLTVDDIFERLLDDYRVNIGQLNANVQLQAVFVLVTLLLILRRSDSLDVFGNTVPLSWLHLLTPLTMMYLWLQFGFVFDDVIEGRIRATQMIDILSPSNRLAGQSLLHDSRFSDGWTVLFVDSPSSEEFGNYSGISRNSQGGTAIFLVLILGAVVAAAHGSVLALLAIGARRYHRPDSARLALYYGAPFAPFIVFVLSHYQFAYGGGNRNSIQFFIAGLTVAIMSFFLWLATRVDAKVDRSTILCLRRARSIGFGPATPTLIGKHASSKSTLRVGLIGDSLSTAFHVDRRWRMLLGLWANPPGSWFVAAEGSSFFGIVNRIAELCHVSATSFASPTAKVSRYGPRSVVDWLTNTYHFGHQVDQLGSDEFPNLLVVWIGHNDLDRKSHVDDEAASADAIFGDYVRHLERVLDAGLRSEEPVLVVVLGLVNFEEFFCARDACDTERRSNPKAFPFFNRAHDIYPAMKPQYRDAMIRTARELNVRLEQYCSGFRKQHESQHLTLLYCSAMSDAPISTSDLLHHSDAWHPSAQGHSLLADEAWNALKPHIVRYLGC
jgi:lysophospholipase L1-like esterase